MHLFLSAVGYNDTSLKEFETKNWLPIKINLINV